MHTRHIFKFASLSHFDVIWVSRKHIVLADSLSKASCLSPIKESEEEVDVASLHVDGIIKDIPVSSEMWEHLKAETKKDSQLFEVIQSIRNGKRLSYPFNNYATELHVLDDLLFKGQQIVIPSTCRIDMLNRIHEGHQGIEKM